MTDPPHNAVLHSWESAGHAIRRTLCRASDPALYSGGDSVDWPWLARWTDKFDVALDDLGVGPGGLVAVPGRNDFMCAATVLALIATGRSAAIFNPFQPPEAMLAAARACAPDIIVMAEQDITKVEPESDDHIAVMAPDGGLWRHCGTKPPECRASDAGLVLPTSGTTGEPKRIPIHQNTLSRALVEIALFNRGFGDRRREDGRWAPLIQYSPLVHVGGALTLLRAAAQARPVVLLRKFEPHAWAEAVREFRPYTTGLPPTMMRMVLDSEIAERDMSSLVSIWSGTAPINSEDRDAFTSRYGLPVLGNYGATEYCGAVVAWTLTDYQDHNATRADAVGRVNPAVARARIRGGDGSVLSEPGAVGILELMVHRVGPQWISTTDRASIDEKGFLFLHGRADDVIMRGGFKVMPDKIAQVLSEHPHVREAVVIGIADERLGQVPAAVLKTPIPEQLDEEQMISFVRSRLPAYFVPVAVRAVSEFPRTSTMKLDRRALRALFTR